MAEPTTARIAIRLVVGIGLMAAGAWFFHHAFEHELWEMVIAGVLGTVGAVVVLDNS